MKLRVAAIACAMVGLMWAAPTASASSTGPIGPGTWTADTPGHDVQLCVGGTVSGTTFALPGGNAPMSACDNNEPRAEFRYKTYAGGASDGNYSTGIRQFGGTFTITSMTGSRIALKQTFNGNSGPYFIMAVENTGRIYSVEGGVTISAGAAKVGVPVQVNTVHNTKTHKFQVYINGTLAYTDTNAPGGEFYDKIGTYQTSTGHGAITVTWSNIHFWHQ
ncbi:MAG TPA: hypothetical protein VG247_03230 [Pseudonocardiaceae bacterium]|jgi:hypothetical protein|nr:hypothetical protein [Pseudonocardiaceae bacterium]